jgi:4-amino-4-deoxy-L-arabinose transferase
LKIAYQFILLITVCTLVFLPWQIYIYSKFPLEAAYEASFNMKHITSALEGQSGPFYYFFDKIRINYGDLIYLPLIWFIGLIFKDLTNKKYLVLLIWFLIPILFFSIAKTKMQGYILFTAPALFIITAMYFDYASKNIFFDKYKWVNKLVLFLLIALPIRYTIERVKPFDNRERNPQWVIDLKNLGKNDIQKGVVFNYPEQIEAMFYTNLTVYDTLPNYQVINDLIKNNYTVIINQTKPIPDELKNIVGVQYENLALKAE